MTERPAARAVTGSYGQVAREYYDESRHPTCANFRQASGLLLRDLTPDVPAGRCCEVGAGDSLLAEHLHRRGEELEGLLLTDASASMLAYSQRWEEHGVRLVVSTAAELPVADASLLLLVASLADPYDTDSFWAEAARVLEPGGRCVLTTPASTWADRFRADTAVSDAAEFELGDGEVVYLPSYVRSPDEERQMIERQGLRVVDEAAALLEDLEAPLSKKLDVLRPGDPVLRAFVGER